MGTRAVDRFMSRAESLCRERRLRFTPQRRRVLEILGTAGRPLGAYEILDALPGAAPPTVYRALDFLLEQGLAHRLETLHAYVGCRHPEHPHCSQFLICFRCGRIDELEDERVSLSLGEAAASSGFLTERRVVELIGTCNRCSRQPGRVEGHGR
jgi:Fur family zinc uptake transcriptional regulator